MTRTVPWCVQQTLGSLATDYLRVLRHLQFAGTGTCTAFSSKEKASVATEELRRSSSSTAPGGTDANDKTCTV